MNDMTFERRARTWLEDGPSSAPAGKPIIAGSNPGAATTSGVNSPPCITICMNLPIPAPKPPAL